MERYFIPPEGGALNPSGRRQPVPDRTLGAQGQRPGGAINPPAHQGVSTFGNTASRRFFTKTQGFPDAANFIKNKKIPYPAGIQRSRIGVFLTSEEVRGDNDMEDEPLFIASLQGEGWSQI